jgi:hypothetical protein
MTESAQAEMYDPAEFEDLDEYSTEALSAPGPARRVEVLRQPDFGEGVRSELQFVMNMRQLGQLYLASHPADGVQALLWRLLASVAISTALAASGLTLTAFALFGDSVRPNPYVSLALLLVGIALCATVATAVRGRGPQLPKR